MKKRSYKTAVDILCEIAGCALLALGIYSFAEQVGIAPGGVSGISLILKHLFGLPVGITGFIINIPLLFLSFRFISKSFTLRSLRVLIICTVMLDVVALNLFPEFSGDRMLGALCAGVLMGAGLGIIFLRGSSTAGTDVLSYLIERKYPSIGIGKAIMLVDSVIISLSALVFKNIESALFGAVSLLCQTLIVDKIVYGSEKGRSLLIISEKSERIAQRILGETGRGATFLMARGAYSGKNTKVLMCVVRVYEYSTVRDIVFSEDKYAFVITSEAAQITGEGFSEPPPVKSTY